MNTIKLNCPVCKTEATVILDEFEQAFPVIRLTAKGASGARKETLILRIEECLRHDTRFKILEVGEHEMTVRYLGDLL